MRIESEDSDLWRVNNEPANIECEHDSFGYTGEFKLMDAYTLHMELKCDHCGMKGTEIFKSQETVFENEKID